MILIPLVYAAEILNLDRDATRRRVLAGVTHYVRIGRQIWIPETEIATSIRKMPKSRTLLAEIRRELILEDSERIVPVPIAL